MASTVVVVFEDSAAADRAVDELRAVGFTADEVGYAGHGEHSAATTEGQAENIAAGAAVGAIPGGVVGGALGAVAVGVIPGVDPIIGAGILASVAGGAAAELQWAGCSAHSPVRGCPRRMRSDYEGSPAARWSPSRLSRDPRRRLAS